VATARDTIDVARHRLFPPVSPASAERIWRAVRVGAAFKSAALGRYPSRVLHVVHHPRVREGGGRD